MNTIVSFFYLIATVMFILGLKMLSSPATARRGNQLSATGMLLAIVGTLWSQGVLNISTIIAGVLLGSAIGVVMGRTVQMTAMPQMVALLNGLGGGASAFVAISEFLGILNAGTTTLRLDTAITIVLSIFLGAVTLSGSFIAFGKLQGLVSGRAVRIPYRHAINAAIAFVSIVLAIRLVVVGFDLVSMYAFALLSVLLGVLLVISIGGADMPVVISLFNSYSGLAGSAAGFVIGNALMIATGALVGASGIILTGIMCRAMNRSLVNVVFGGVGGGGGAASALETGEERIVREARPDEVAMILGYARSVIFVPGYGLAVSQAQHPIHDLAQLLEARGVETRYAIHPVAGRMPGHMNILLAEANVPYDKLFDLDQINSDFDRTDAVVVVGANDVVNPVARHAEGSPIYGMPILDVDKAKTVFVLKRSMNTGFAGIDNELFYKENTMMVFGDAKASLTSIIGEVKAL